MAVLICTNFVISCIKKITPDMVRIPVFIVVIAAFVTILQMGRRDRSQTIKRVARILLAFVLVAVFCVTVAFVAYRAEIIGGRTVPNVVGWSAQSAQSRLEECGFSVGVNEVSSSEQDPGKVVSEAPAAGARIDPGSTVSIDVAVASQ